MTALPNPPLKRVPLYKQIADHLAERILGGQFPEGFPLPNEYALSCQYGVSIGTIRSAIEELVEDRLVIRKQGRGTFVRNERSLAVSEKVIRIRFGKSAEFGSWGYRELDYQRINATHDVADELELSQGEEVHFFRRLRYCSGKSDLILETGYAPVKIFPEFPKDENGRRDTLSVARRNGVVIGPVERKVSACSASGEDAGALNVEPTTPLLRIQRRILDRAGVPIETRVMLYAVGEGYFWSYDE